MILCVLTSPENIPEIKQFDWVQKYNFAILTEKSFENITQVVFCNKPKLYTWLRNTYGNVIIVGYSLVDSTLADLTVTYKVTANKLLKPYAIDYVNQAGVNFDISSEIPDKMKSYIEYYACIDKKGGIDVNNIADSLKKAMIDLGLTELDDEDSAPIRPTVEPTPVKEPEPVVPEIQVDVPVNESETPEVLVEPVEISVQPEKTVTPEITETTSEPTETVEDVKVSDPDISDTPDELDVPLKQIVIPKEQPIIKNKNTEFVNSSITRCQNYSEFVLLGRKTNTGFELLIDDSLLTDVIVNNKSYKSIQFNFQSVGTVKDTSVKSLENEPLKDTSVEQIMSNSKQKPPVNAYLTQFPTMESLKAEKQRLDNEINNAKTLNDYHKVEELKKFRRQIRLRIRTWSD